MSGPVAGGTRASVLDHIGRTPLVPLRRVARDVPVPVLAKCEHLNPGGSVKDRIALAIVDDAERRGVLRPGATLIEATAGNTGMGLALVASVKGYRMVFTLPDKMSMEKIRLLRAFGAEVIVTPTAVVADFGVSKNGVSTLNTRNQYTNLSIHGFGTAVETTADQPTWYDYRTTAPNISKTASYDATFFANANVTYSF